MADKTNINDLTPEQLEKVLAIAKSLNVEAQSITDLRKLDLKTIKAIVDQTAKILGLDIRISKIYKEDEKTGRKILEAIQTRAKIEEEIKNDAKALIIYVKKIKSLNQDILAVKAEILKLEKEDSKANADTIDYLNKRVKLLTEERDLIISSVKETSKFGAGLKLAAKAVASIADGVQKGYSMIKNSGLFEMDKAIKNSALSMGILSKQSDQFATQLTQAANDTIEFGVGIEDLAKAQSSYSDAMGRTVILGKNAAKQLGAMAASTGLGAEGAGEFAGDMDRIGVSAERTAEYVEQTMNDAHAMGLNSSKVIKTISANIRLLNKYNFKGGAKSLAKMAEDTQRMGVDLQLVAPMAEKLFNVEGAVEMSAQLQVLGGEWAKLADPFKLMYMARNDMEGLTKAVINASTATAKFNKETGEFDISSLEMQRLRSVAEATGLDFEQLAQSAKKAAQFAGIKKQISYGFDKETEKFIESTAFLNKSGRASIDIDGKGTTKFVNELNAADKTLLMQRAKEKESMAERAKGARTFDDTFNNTVTLFKQMLLPIITTMNEKLIPKVDAFVKSFKASDWPDKILKFAKTIGDIASWVGSFIIKHPIISGLVLATKVLSPFMDKLTWFSNGIALGKGFLMTTGGGGSIGGKGGGFLGGMSGKLAGGLGGAAMGGIDALSANSVGEGVGNVVGGIVGGIAGTFLDEFIGPAGTILGAKLGSWAGGKLGSMLSDAPTAQAPTTVNDGVIQFNPKDKFMKVNDGMMVAGTNVNGNKDLAGQLARRTDTISPVGGSQGPGSLNVNFSQLMLGGTVELKMGGTYNKEFGRELIQDPSFVRSITRLIHMETEKNLNSGKPKG